MTAQNYIKINIGRLSKYDKLPEFFDLKMVEILMEGYAKHKTKRLYSAEQILAAAKQGELNMIDAKWIVTLLEEGECTNTKT
jgi:hypothetical protein